MLRPVTTLFNSVTRTKLLIVLVLVGMTLFTYQSVRKYEFVAYDDDRYITANPRIQQGLTPKNVAWAFTAAHSSNWRTS